MLSCAFLVMQSLCRHTARKTAWQQNRAVYHRTLVCYTRHGIPGTVSFYTASGCCSVEHQGAGAPESTTRLCFAPNSSRWFVGPQQRHLYGLGAVPRLRPFRHVPGSGVVTLLVQRGTTNDTQGVGTATKACMWHYSTVKSSAGFLWWLSVLGELTFGMIHETARNMWIDVPGDAYRCPPHPGTATSYKSSRMTAYEV